MQRPLYLTSTLRAPRGVTRVAGANAYAAKLAASPAPTIKGQEHILIYQLFRKEPFVMIVE